MRKRKPVATATLTFRGLDLCDGCGARLDLGDRLSALCQTCLDPKATGSRTKT